MASRHRTSPEQFAIIVEYMENHGDISRPQKGPQGRIVSDRSWEALTDILNSTGGGGTKPVEKWKKVWADFKTKTKTKALKIRRHAAGTGGGPNSRIILTPLEERVLAIIGVAAVDGQQGIGEQGFGSQMEPPALSEEHVVQFESEYDSQDIFSQSPILPPYSQPSTSGGLHAAAGDAEAQPSAVPSAEPQPSTSRGLHAATGSVEPQPSTSRGQHAETSGAEPQPSTSRGQHAATGGAEPLPSTSRGQRAATGGAKPRPSTSRGQQAATGGAEPRPSTSRGPHAAASVPSRARRPTTPDATSTPNAASPQSSAATTPQSRQRRPAVRCRRRSQMTPFERACAEFAAIENRRVRNEEVRDRQNHKREALRLQIETEKIKVQQKQNELLERLVSLAEILVRRETSND